jgi:serine/threonine protein kinase
MKPQQTFTTISGSNSNKNSSTTEDEKIGPHNFIPIKLLGSGSFGEVYLVKEKKTSNLFAMKVLSK